MKKSLLIEYSVFTPKTSRLNEGVEGNKKYGCRRFSSTCPKNLTIMGELTHMKF